MYRNLPAHHWKLPFWPREEYQGTLSSVYLRGHPMSLYSRWLDSPFSCLSPHSPVAPRARRRACASSGTEAGFRSSTRPSAQAAAEASVSGAFKASSLKVEKQRDPRKAWLLDSFLRWIQWNPKVLQICSIAQQVETSLLSLFPEALSIISILQAKKDPVVTFHRGTLPPFDSYRKPRRPVCPFCPPPARAEASCGSWAATSARPGPPAAQREGGGRVLGRSKLGFLYNDFKQLRRKTVPTCPNYI